MDELEDTSAIFKPKRQETTNVTAGSTSEDGDYKRLNEKRKEKDESKDNLDVPVLEESIENISEILDVPEIALRRTSVIDTRYEDFKRNLFSSVADGNRSEVTQALSSLPAHVSMESDVLRETLTGKNILHVALESKQNEIAQYLIENGSKEFLSQTFKAEKDFKTALHQITENNNIKLANVLLNRLSSTDDKINAIKAETVVEVEGQRPRSLSSFHLAAFKGYTTLVKLYVETGIDINFPNSKRDTALLWASRWGHLETVAYLLDLKADAMLENDKDSTALHWAVRYEHKDVVKMLLTKGKADPNKERLQGLVAPIVLASALGNAKIAEILLDNGASANHVIRGGETPLHYAAKEGNFAVIGVLLRFKAEVNRQDHNGNTPLINAASNDHLKCIDVLMRAGADATIKNYMGHDSWYFALLSENNDVLHIICRHSKHCKIPHLTAAKFGKINKINVLRQIGIDIRAVDDDGNSLIHFAACYDQDHVISEFQSKVDLNIQNKKGNTALHVACLKGHFNSIKALTDAKARADIGNQDKHFALHITALSPNTTPEIAAHVVEYTIKSHAWESLNSVDIKGDNALHLAAEKANPDVVWEFRQVRFKDADNKGNTPLHDAVRPGNPEVLETMLDVFESMQRDADINTSNLKRETVLHLVASQGFQQSLKRIVFLGGDLACQDINGNTVLHRLILESSHAESNKVGKCIEMVDVIINSSVRWWCMRHGIPIPNQNEPKYIEHQRKALLYLLYDIKNKNSLSVLGLACRQANSEILAKLMEIEGVTCFREDKSTSYDVTFFTPKTSLSAKKPIFGKQVDPGFSSTEKSKNPETMSFLQLLIQQSDKQKCAKVLNIRPLQKMEEMFKTISMVTYLTIMFMHIVYMSVFSYAGVTLLGKLRNSTDLPTSDYLLVYIWVPLEPAFFFLYSIIAFVRMIKRGDGIHSLAWKFILFFSVFSILAIAWVILVSLNYSNNDYILALVLCIGWLITIGITGGIKGIHYFWRMLKNMIFRDIFRFLVFYTIVLLAFTFAFHSIFQKSEDVVDTYSNPGHTLFMVFNLMIGMAELFDDAYEDGMNSVGRTTAFSKVLYMFYIVSSTIILLNLLIAMMNDSYSSIIAHERIIWRIDSVDIGLKIEKTIPWVSSFFDWLYKRNLLDSTAEEFGERWYVRVEDGELLENERRRDRSLAENIKNEMDIKIKSIDNRVDGLEKNIQDTHKKMNESSAKLDAILEYMQKKKIKKEKRKEK